MGYIADKLLDGLKFLFTDYNDVEKKKVIAQIYSTDEIKHQKQNTTNSNMLYHVGEWYYTEEEYRNIFR